MIIYNVTFNLEEFIEKEWYYSMQEVHIPKIMNIGIFISSKMSLVIVNKK